MGCCGRLRSVRIHRPALLRNRQHRIILAFYLSIAFAIVLDMVGSAIAAKAPRPFSGEYPILTTLIMVFVVMGFVNVFSIPVSLTANWVLRTTQLHPASRYFAATRNTLLLLATLPAWLLCVGLGLTVRPMLQVAAHLAVLFLFGLILTETSLVNFHKVPFTCLLLPGNTNIQLVFWRTAAGVILLAMFVTSCEIPSLSNGRLYALLILTMGGIVAALWLLNQSRAKSAVLYYEEVPEAVITSLRLIAPGPTASTD